MQTTPPTSVAGPSTASTASTGRRDARQQKLWDQCCQFEAVLLGLMLKSMRRTVPEQGGVLPSSAGLKVTEELFDEKLADQVSRAGRSGLARLLYDTFLRADRGTTEMAAPELDESA
jgi:Rod binding domain-containing protein